MPEIQLIREKRTIQCDKGATLRSVLMREGVEVYRNADSLINCRGNGLCGTCVVEITPAEAANDPTIKEKAKLWQFGDRPMRFSCQVKVKKDCKVLSQPQLTQGWLEHPYYAHLKEGVDN
ncbi:MAG: 2Fe-2S iron-sulfur cluster-binding protein [Planctomycetota bacterium]|jgi:ferredoxin